MTGVILLMILVLVIKSVIKPLSKTILMALLLIVRSIKATLYRKKQSIAMRVALKRRQPTLPLIANGSPTGKTSRKASNLQLRVSQDGYNIMISSIVKRRVISGHY